MYTSGAAAAAGKITTSTVSRDTTRVHVAVLY